MAKPVDIYNGRDPNTLPLFTYAEVARWLRMPPSTVRDRIKAHRPYGEKRKQVSFLELHELWDESGRKHGDFVYLNGSTIPSCFKPMALITVDPRVQFGRPTSLYTGILTSVLAARVEAGESVKAIAEDYGIEEIDVAAAVRFENASRPPETEEEAKAQARRLMHRHRKTFEALED